MSIFVRRFAFAAAVFAAVFAVAGAASPPSALAQAPAGASAPLGVATVKALQEALNKQGIAVKTDGVLDEETRAAIRTYQSQHHLPVTGEPDKATLDKLGVAARQGGAAPAAPAAPGQATMGQGTMGGGMMKPGHGMMGQGGPGMAPGAMPQR